jgi:hypothetical protein
MPPIPDPPEPLDVDSVIGEILDDIDPMLHDAMGAGVTGGTIIKPGAYQQIADVPGLLSEQALRSKIRDGFRLAFAALLKRVFFDPDGGISVPPTFEGTCSTSEAVGDVVFVNGPGKDVRKTDIADPNKVSSVGVVISKPTTTTCVVQVSGLISGIYTGLTPNSRYFLGADARPTATKPTGSEGSPTLVVALGIAIDTNLFLLRPTTVVRARS